MNVYKTFTPPADCHGCAFPRRLTGGEMPSISHTCQYGRSDNPQSVCWPKNEPGTIQYTKRNNDNGEKVQHNANYVMHADRLRACMKRLANVLPPPA